MSLDISTLCAGPFEPEWLDQKYWRVVEAQFKNSTRALVDNSDEQEILEDIVEEVKPPYVLPPEDVALRNLHWLLWTPFRYRPPLKGGTRFGTHLDPAIWYGAEKIPTALAEFAYSRLVFIEGSAAARDLTINQPLTAFQAHIQTAHSIDLTKAPYSDYEDLISSPTAHVAAQQLGSALRKSGMEALVFTSSRCPERGRNVALFVPAFGSPRISGEAGWSMHATFDGVEFIKNFSKDPTRHLFRRNVFEVDGELPQPLVSG